MTEQRVKRFRELVAAAHPCKVLLYTPSTIPSLQVPGSPFHPAYPYLSAVHRADYLRAYVMHHHGGGYSDIKTPYGWPWYDAFRDFDLKPQAMINYRAPGTAMICRPRTEFTTRWYTSVCKVLDEKLDALRRHPATSPYVSRDNDPEYPLDYLEIMFYILNPLIQEYTAKGYVVTSVPLVFVHNHR
jgi:mannosyltransferase OCH1-like enzyme